MIPLHVEFQDGWDGTPVEILLDGDRLAALEPRTRMQTGFAAAVESEVETGRHVVEVSVAASGAAPASAFEHELDVSVETWLGISRTADGIVFREQRTLFGYV